MTCGNCGPGWQPFEETTPGGPGWQPFEETTTPASTVAASTAAAAVDRVGGGSNSDRGMSGMGGHRGDARLSSEDGKGGGKGTPKSGADSTH